MNRVVCLVLLSCMPLAACTSTGTTSDAGVPDANVERWWDAGPRTWPEQNQFDELPLNTMARMPVAAGQDTISVLAANVGNIDVLRCGGAVYKLCNVDSELAVKTRLRDLRPDVVLLQEVITPTVCARIQDLVDDQHVCHPAHTAVEPEQPRRLLGPDYTITCDDRAGYECIAVHRDVGTLDGCATGSLCRGAAHAVDAVMGCDDGFTITGNTATVRGQRVDLFSAHPQSGNTSANQQCRKAYLDQVLDPNAGLPLRVAPRAILGGDLNMDPWRTTSADPEVVTWNTFVTPHNDDVTRPWTYHSGAVEHDPPYWSAWLVHRTWDHVISDGYQGRCVTLGAAPDVAPLDFSAGAQDIDLLDHLALWCHLAPR